MVSAMLHVAHTRNRMKNTWLTAQELAALIQVSLKTVRRAYRNGEIPMVFFRHMVRFDLAQVRRTMARNGRSRVLRLNRNSERAERDRRRQPAARPAKRPRLVTRGHYPQGSLQEVYGFDEFPLHPHH
jgi:excisionase family DNA binding protein